MCGVLADVYYTHLCIAGCVYVMCVCVCEPQMILWFDEIFISHLRILGFGRINQRKITQQSKVKNFRPGYQAVLTHRPHHKLLTLN